MARLIVDDNQPNSIKLMYSAWRMLAIGAALGLTYWIVTLMMSRYIIDPIYCKSAVDAAVCSGSVGMGGNIASIVLATIGLGLLIRYSVARPIIIAVASAVALWGLAGWTEGLAWYEIALWSALLYGLVYVLFSWICRYNRTIPVVFSVLVILLVVRVVAVL
jgi:hypothetical protein